MRQILIRQFSSFCADPDYDVRYNNSYRLNLKRNKKHDINDRNK